MDLTRKNLRLCLILCAAVGILLCLGCKSVEDKRNEIGVCEKSGDEQSIKTLLKYLKDKEEKVREEAAYALGARTCCWCPHHGEPTKIGQLNDARVMKALLESLQDESPRVRLAAAHSLTVYENPIMVEPLIEALNDTSGKVEINPQHPVGSYAAHTLGKLNDKRAIEPLINALKSEDKDIRSWASDALRTLGEEERLTQEIKNFTPLFLNELQSESPDIIDRGTYTVGLFRISEAVPRLNELMKHDESKIRACAAEALSRIGNETSIPMLIEALEDAEPAVRGQAATTLGQMKAKSALPGILLLLQDNERTVQVSVIHTLSFFDEPEIFPPLVKAIGDDDINVARAAIYVLGEKFFRNQGNPQAHKDLVPRVLQMMQRMTPSDGCRHQAVKILISTQDERALSEVRNEFKRQNVEGPLFHNESELRIKMAAFIAKVGRNDQRNEAIEWLKQVKNENPNKYNQKYAAEALKELGLAED